MPLSKLRNSIATALSFKTLTEEEEMQEKKKLDEARLSFETKKTLMKQVFPYVWPDEFWLKVRVVLALIDVALGRVINLYVPVMYKNSVDALSGPNIYLPHFALAMYSFLKFASVSNKDLRSILWIPVGQNTRRRISMKVFRHLHSLSLQYHLHRKTGEVLRVVERGTSSIETLLNIFCFNVGPTLIDVLIVCFVFLGESEFSIALTILITIVLYLTCTFAVTEWRTKYRKRMNAADNACNDKAVDSLLNFETVKYFGGEEHEAKEYERNIYKMQGAQTASELSLALLNGLQSFVLSAGLLVSMYLSGIQVQEGEISVGSFVMVNAYVLQLTAPLNWLGTSYRMIQTAFIDMEKMVTLLQTEAGIKDKEGAEPIKIEDGMVEFDNVTFSYEPTTTILSNLSFRVPPSHTVAFVGSTGAGKSTIARLLFRFYDVQSGSIRIDGQDLRDVQQISLRQAIGVVPQDTVLFNDTIKFNIAYGKFNATDEEIDAAAQMARIKDRILTFPNGYDTRVGERGLRLSGGEKQRVAIARTMLKNPRIVILDEATSALDNKTERQVQEALSDVTAGRTTIVIAHRLSTVVNANCIFVLKDGKAVEQGTHEELLQMAGEYATLWAEQLKSTVEGEIAKLDDSSVTPGAGAAALKVL